MGEGWTVYSGKILKIFLGNLEVSTWIIQYVKIGIKVCENENIEFWIDLEI